jgi:hypothetical protein
MAVEDEYLDVLQNIEAAIIAVYTENSDLIDSEVATALDALIRIYGAEAQGKSISGRPVRGMAKEVMDNIQPVCEFRLGRQDFNGQPSDLTISPITPDIIVSCLKRLQSSIKFWTQKGGRQGYLNFVRPFVH